MIEEPKIKKVDKRDKQLPQNFEQLIEMYNVEKIWPYMKKVIDYINNDLEKIKVSPTEPTTNEKVWIQKGKNLFKELQNMKEVTGQYKVLALGNISTVEGETYTISFDTNNNGGDVYVHEAIFNYGTAICDGTRKSITVTAKHTKTFHNHTVINSISSVNTPYDISNVQIEQGATATEYEPYVEPRLYCKNDNSVFEEFYKEKTSKVLWTNSNPSSSIGYTNNGIILSSGDYDELEIWCKFSATSQDLLCTKTKKGYNATITTFDGWGGNIYNRTFAYTTDTSYTINVCYAYGKDYPTPPFETNDKLIPVFVIGYKN